MILEFSDEIRGWPGLCSQFVSEPVKFRATIATAMPRLPGPARCRSRHAPRA